MYDACFPIKMLKEGYRTRKPWLSEEMKRSIKVKNKQYKIMHYKKSGNREDEMVYKKYRNTLNKILVEAERKHYESLLNENKSKLKKSWCILKEVINKKKASNTCSRFLVNGQITNDKKKIANGFNKYFINIGPNLANKIPDNNKSPTTYIVDRVLESMVIAAVVENKVKSIIKCFKDSSSGWDAVSAKVVKATHSSFITPLTNIMNLSLRYGIFPAELKIARVIPLFKSDDSGSFSNYRPVSVLPLFSKILERLMYQRLLSFINKHNILYSF